MEISWRPAAGAVPGPGRGGHQGSGLQFLCPEPFQYPGAGPVTSLSACWEAWRYSGIKQDPVKGIAHWEFLGKMNDVKDNIRALAKISTAIFGRGPTPKACCKFIFPVPIPPRAAMHRFGPEQGLPGLSGLRAGVRGNTTLCRCLPRACSATIPLGAPSSGTDPLYPGHHPGQVFIDPPVALNIMIFDQEGGVFFHHVRGRCLGHSRKMVSTALKNAPSGAFRQRAFDGAFPPRWQSVAAGQGTLPGGLQRLEGL